MNDGCLALDAWLLAAGAVGVVVVVADKRRARTGRRRVPELVFHALGLLGSYGVILAMWLVRHKTRKPRFLVPFMAANVLSLAWVIALGIRLNC
ncbi:MAG: DUF1294 domain-containing protein [Candidatus Thermoplasmatota archaeon]